MPCALSVLFHFTSPVTIKPAMALASETVSVAPGVRIWQAYDPAVKADLFSTAIATKDGFYLVDPIPLEDEVLAELVGEGSIAGIIVTNANHLRAASHFAQRFSVPIFARSQSILNEPWPDFREVGDGGSIGDELRVIGVDGAAPAEIVLYHMPNGGTLVVGDALINFEPYGFNFLPGKYCSNEEEMWRSLRKLLAAPAERMLFAHGTPLTSHAHDRLQRLLNIVS